MRGQTYRQADRQTDGKQSLLCPVALVFEMLCVQIQATRKIQDSVRSGHLTEHEKQTNFITCKLKAKSD